MDSKYVGLLSMYVKGFVVKSNIPYQANMRCPICGDSEKSIRKKRGWLLERSNRVSFYCHNCNVSISLGNLLKTLNPSLGEEYLTDSFIEKRSRSIRSDKIDVESFKTDTKFSNVNTIKLKKISQLPPNHGAKKYVVDRKIPSHSHYRIYYCSRFSKWVHSYIPDKFDTNTYDRLNVPRLILPFFDEENNMFGFQARSFSKKESFRYMTIMLDENRSKIFGLDKVNFDDKYYVTEGPIDSLFLKNSIALAGTNTNLSELKNTGNATFVFDLEPRNSQIVDRMKKCIEMRNNICILPHTMLKYGKDLNDFALSGMSLSDIKKMIDNHTYTGLEAELKLSEWRKS